MREIDLSLVALIFLGSVAAWGAVALTVVYGGVAMQELEQVVDFAGSFVLPGWAMLLPLGWRAAMTLIFLFTPLCTAWVTARGALQSRAAKATLAWLKKPSESSQMKADLAEIRRQMDALMAPATNAAPAPGEPCVFRAAVGGITKTG